jgi:DNA relaxase NicK
MLPTGTPPSSNTGVRGTSQRAVEAKIDYLGWTVQASLGDVLALFGEVEWMEQRYGGMGYRRSWVNADGARVFSDGAVGMGVHVEMAGQALENWRARTGEDVVEWWRSVWLHVGARLTRVDVAWDVRGSDAEALLDGVWGAARRREFLSKARHVQGFWDGHGGRTVYVGRRGSERMLRVYDKRAERRAVGQLVAEAWTRVEWETRGRAAEQAMVAVIDGGWQQVLGLLRGFVDFREPGPGDRRRWGLPSWWEAFVAGVERAFMALPRRVSSVAGRVRWVEKQVAGVLAVLVDGGGGPWLRAALDAARRRARPEDGWWVRRAEEYFGVVSV